MNRKVSIPFGLLHKDLGEVDRGYGIYPEKWHYDPSTQVSDLLMMGETTPTTVSSILSTGGFDILPPDSDEGVDDTGKD